MKSPILFSVATKKDELRYYIDVTELHVPRPGMEVQTYMKDGQIDNWDLFEKMLDYCYSKVNFDYHLLLLYFKGGKATYHTFNSKSLPEGPIGA